jgi:hypothetical protein
MISVKEMYCLLNLSGYMQTTFSWEMHVIERLTFVWLLQKLKSLWLSEMFLQTKGINNGWTTKFVFKDKNEKLSIKK